VDLGWLDSAFLATYAFGRFRAASPPTDSAAYRVDRAGPPLVARCRGRCLDERLLAVDRCACRFRLAQAGVYPVLNKMTRTWFPFSSRTTVQGIVTALGRIGGASAPLVVAYLLMAD